MKKLGFLIHGFLLLSLFTEGQYKNSATEMELTTIAQVNQGNSYITFPADIGNIERLWFEANVSPGFYLRQSKDSRLMGVVTPQIIIRMYQEESYPIRTPSYMPQITAYYLLSPKRDIGTLSLFAKMAHHSNGQDGESYLENGDINLLTGNFATNYFEIGAIKTNFISRFNAHRFLKTSLEVHPYGRPVKELDDKFGTVRWHNAFSFFKMPVSDEQKDINKAAISLKGEITWLFDDWGVRDNFSGDSFNLKLTFFYHPKFLEDIGFFVQAYHGMDYYNIYFSHELNVIRFGIMSEKLRF